MAKLVIGTSKSVVVPAVVREVPPVEKYALLSRVKDDNNNEIGTVCGYHTDANNQKYAVVCLDAQYRLASGQWLSALDEIPDLPSIRNQTVWESTATATSNCTKILDFATANGYTSSAVSHCRSKSFVIEGTTYYGQLPNITELIDIYRNRTIINTKDTSATQYSGLVIPYNVDTVSSSQDYTRWVWGILSSADITGLNKMNTFFINPILEIPID